MFCTECDLLGKDHLLAFDRYKVMTLEYSLAGGYVDDEERHSASLVSIDEARRECDTAMLAMLTHAASHETRVAEVICMPVR